MIRHDIDFEQLERDVDLTKPTWRVRAVEVNQRMWRARPRRFDESGPAWSDIKGLFVRLQQRKCGYCERTLDGDIEYDVEHYRPKQRVRPWSHSRERARPSQGNPRGYCMLAYDLRNYCVACKTCNSTYKSDYFPIAGKPGRADARDVARLNALERPLLIYPIGRLDDDPEALIGFVGFVPIPRTRSGHRHRRARVTIALLALDSRSELTRGRSGVIRALWLMLREADRAPTAELREQLASLTSGREPHTACARAFVRLYQSNRDAARAVYEQACDHLAKTS